MIVVRLGSQHEIKNIVVALEINKPPDHPPPQQKRRQGHDGAGGETAEDRQAMPAD
jgi:hypothetical protein